MSRQESSSVRRLLVTSFCVFFAGAGIAEGADPSSDKPVAFDAHDAQLKWGPCPPLFPKGCEIAVLRGDPSEPNVFFFFFCRCVLEGPGELHHPTSLAYVS